MQTALDLETYHPTGGKLFINRSHN
jgi:hypothetical protein